MKKKSDAKQVHYPESKGGLLTLCQYPNREMTEKKEEVTCCVCIKTMVANKMMRAK